MCRATTCRTCGKTTWAGCGQHIEQALASVPAGERCPPVTPRSRPRRDSSHGCWGGENYTCGLGAEQPD